MSKIGKLSQYKVYLQGYGQGISRVSFPIQPFVFLKRKSKIQTPLKHKIYKR